MLDTQNQSPQCVDCDSPMMLTAIEPGGLGQDLRTFTREKCKRDERHIIESAVTEEWLEPQRAIKARHGNAVTHEVREGRMIPKPAMQGGSTAPITVTIASGGGAGVLRKKSRPEGNRNLRGRGKSY
jgi:hypothetical protein